MNNEKTRLPVDARKSRSGLFLKCLANWFLNIWKVTNFLGLHVVRFMAYQKLKTVRGRALFPTNMFLQPKDLCYLSIMRPIINVLEALDKCFASRIHALEQCKNSYNVTSRMRKSRSKNGVRNFEKRNLQDSQIIHPLTPSSCLT